MSDCRRVLQSVAVGLTGGLCLGAAPVASSSVRLSGPSCTDWDLARLDELIAIEIQTVGHELTARQSDVFLECGDGVVSIQASVRKTSLSRSSTVEPRSMDRAAATRLLALRITELLAQLWSESPPPSSPQQTPPTATTMRDEPVAPRSATGEHDFVAYAGAAFRSMFEPRAGLFGGTLRVEYGVLRPVTLAFDLEGAFGSVRTEHASVSAVLGSAAAYALIDGRFGRTALGIGPGGRFGWVNLSPGDLEPNAVGSDVSGAWAGPLLLGRARWSGDGYLLYSSVEAGVVALPVVGTVNGADPELEVRGVWLAASVGIGMNL